MKRFFFPFDRILRLKEHQEQLAKEAFAMCVQKTEEVKAKLHETQQDLADLDTAETKRREKTVRIDNLIAYENRHLFFLEGIEKSSKELKKNEENMEKVRLELVKATQEKQKYEKLKEKKWKNYVREYEKENQAEMDEIGNLLYNQKQSSMVGK